MGRTGQARRSLTHCWDEDRRALLRAELDARIARLYGFTRDQFCCILDPAARLLILVEPPWRGDRRWEVAAQLGHSVGKDCVITERFAFYGPDYLSRPLSRLTG